jgi:hypothetical protein
MSVFWGVVGFAIGFNLAVAFAWWTRRRENRKATIWALGFYWRIRRPMVELLGWRGYLKAICQSERLGRGVTGAQPVDDVVSNWPTSSGSDGDTA